MTRTSNDHQELGRDLSCLVSRQTFDLIDSDGSGTLETGELEEWFRMCGAELDLSTLLEVLVGGQVSSHSCQTLVPPPCVVSRAANDPSVFTITERAPFRAFSWLKAPTSNAITFKTLLRHYTLNRR